MLTIHLQSDEHDEALEGMVDELALRSAQDADFRGLICLEVGEHSASVRRKLMVVSLWDEAGADRAELIAEASSAEGTETLGTGIPRERARIVRLVGCEDRHRKLGDVC